MTTGEHRSHDQSSFVRAPARKRPLRLKSRSRNKHLFPHVTTGTRKLPEVRETWMLRPLVAKEVKTNGFLTLEPLLYTPAFAVACVEQQCANTAPTGPQPLMGLRKPSRFPCSIPKPDGNKEQQISNTARLQGDGGLREFLPPFAFALPQLNQHIT